MKLDERGDGCMGRCTRRHSTFAVCGRAHYGQQQGCRVLLISQRGMGV